MEPDTLGPWLAAHPGGVAVDHFSNRWRELGRQPDRVLDYRGKQLGLWFAPGNPAGCTASRKG